jgi:hypothetical protein
MLLPMQLKLKPNSSPGSGQPDPFKVNRTAIWWPGMRLLLPSMLDVQGSKVVSVVMSTPQDYLGIKFG